jgi:hypothetical protein
VCAVDTTHIQLVVILQTLGSVFSVCIQIFALCACKEAFVVTLDFLFAIPRGVLRKNYTHITPMQEEEAVSVTGNA